MARKPAENGLEGVLQTQVHKIIDGTNEGSFKTRARYRDAADRFCSFLADEFKLQKFANVQEKHVTAYVKHLVDSGASSKYIRNELSAIRWVHGKSGSRHTLPGNDSATLKNILPERVQGGVDRAWTKTEIEDAKMLALSMDRRDVALGIDIARCFGLRINELASVTVKQFKDALEVGELTIKGKGGQIRHIPVRTDEQVAVLRAGIEYAKEKESTRIISSDKKYGVQKEKQSLSDWMVNHRGKFEENFREKNSEAFEKMKTQCEQFGFKLKAEHCTWHGLRYGYAQDRHAELYKEFREAGYSHDVADKKACAAVSRELGHHRDSITRIYLSATRK